MGTKERWKVYGNVFDEFTIKTLQKLSTQGYFTDLKSSLSLGKEANIFSATKDDGSLVIVKIYRLQNCNFNAMFNYIKTDPRYANLHGQKRRIIFEWVRREFRNLLKARESGVRVPTPIHFLHNVIVMEFISDDEDLALPAPQVKNAIIHDPANFFSQILKQMQLLYTHAQIVHADLSMFNILMQNQQPIFIDMSQSTAINDPHAKEYLLRDCQNMMVLAKRIGVSVDMDTLYADIIADQKADVKVQQDKLIQKREAKTLAKKNLRNESIDSQSETDEPIDLKRQKKIPHSLFTKQIASLHKTLTKSEFSELPQTQKVTLAKQTGDLCKSYIAYIKNTESRIPLDYEDVIEQFYILSEAQYETLSELPEQTKTEITQWLVAHIDETDLDVIEAHIGIATNLGLEGVRVKLAQIEAKSKVKLLKSTISKAMAQFRKNWENPYKE